MSLPLMTFRTHSYGTWYGLHSSNFAHYSPLFNSNVRLKVTAILEPLYTYQNLDKRSKTMQRITRYFRGGWYYPNFRNWRQKRLIIDYLQWIWQEELMAQSQYFHGFCLEGKRKTNNNVQGAGVMARLRKKYLLIHLQGVIAQSSSFYSPLSIFLQFKQ